MGKKQEKKHLFGSSEKSDFILNMTEEGTKKLCGRYCFVAMILIALSAIPYYFTRNIMDYEQKIGATVNSHYLSEKTIFIISGMFFAVGLIGFLILLVGHMKKEVILKDNKSLWILVGIAVWSAISTFCAASFSDAFYGHFARMDGFLSIMAYLGLFVMAMTITDENWKSKIANVLVGIGTFNAIVGILQRIPALKDKIPNYFTYLFNSDKILAGQGELSEEFVATGFSTTPHALIGILTICFAIAFSGVVFDNNKVKKIIYSVCALLMAVCSVFTSIIPAVIGIGVATLMVMIFAIIKTAKSKQKSFAIIGVIGFLLVGAIYGISASIGELKFQDEKIIFTDCVERLDITQGYREDESKEIYSFLWEDGLYVAQNKPIVGVGPDNWGTAFSFGATIDRAYNEYIDIAAYRGFLGLALYICLLIVTLIKAFKAVKSFLLEEKNWVAVAITSGIIAYMIQAFFNISTVTSTSYFWICLGLVWSYTAKKKLSKDK